MLCSHHFEIFKSFWKGSCISLRNSFHTFGGSSVELSPGEGMHYPLSLLGLPGGSDAKESTCHAGDLGSISRLGRSPGEGNGYPLQYSCLENSMDRRTLQAAVHGVTKGQTGWATHFHGGSCKGRIRLHDDSKSSHLDLGDDSLTAFLLTGVPLLQSLLLYSVFILIWKTDPLQC